MSEANEQKPQPKSYRPKLRNSWTIRQAVGEPLARISVRNLQATIQVGRDAWGREGKIQPVLISATVSLREPFEKASVHDIVNESTIHYGILSKAILEAVESFHREGGMLKPSGNGHTTTVNALMERIAGHLTMDTLDGRRYDGPSTVNGGLNLPREKIKALELTVTLPKALLNSTTGVSRYGIKVYDAGSLKSSDTGDSEEVQSEDEYSASIKLHDLRVATLIGVNANERLAKQLVIASIEIDEWITERDIYNELEEVVVKSMEESSFQTLESLAAHLGLRITRCIINPIRASDRAFIEQGSIDFDPRSRPRPRIKISLEKPTAVTMADAPVVELLIETPESWDEQNMMLPFPLQGSIGKYIAAK